MKFLKVASVYIYTQNYLSVKNFLMLSTTYIFKYISILLDKQVMVAITYE